MCVSVIVKDRGPGISAIDQDRIFRPFVKLSNSSRLNPNGVGLGLFVCRVICERLGGDICCYSEKDQGVAGATFEFRFLLDGIWRQNVSPQQQIGTRFYGGHEAVRVLSSSSLAASQRASEMDLKESLIFDDKLSRASDSCVDAIDKIDE